MPNVPPQRRYRESSKVLGRGSFGVVRLARDTVSGDDVVVKRVALEAGDLEEAREEVRVLRELHHPHICRVLDAWETPSALCIVMPFYAAGDLQHRLKSRSEVLPPDEVCSLAAQLLLALQYVHARNLLHRDIKPANVLLAADGTAKLADFGVARRLASSCELAQTFVGTPCYMAPELHLDAAYASPADIWSLGCTLHECCTLQPAFLAASAAELAAAVVRGRCTAPMPRGVPRPLQQLVASMLRVRPAARPEAAELLRGELLRPMLQRLRRPGSGGGGGGRRAGGGAGAGAGAGAAARAPPPGPVAMPARPPLTRWPPPPPPARAAAAADEVEVEDDDSSPQAARARRHARRRAAEARRRQVSEYLHATRRRLLEEPTATPPAAMQALRWAEAAHAAEAAEAEPDDDDDDDDAGGDGDGTDDPLGEGSVDAAALLDMAEAASAADATAVAPAPTRRQLSGGKEGNGLRLSEEQMLSCMRDCMRDAATVRVSDASEAAAAVVPSPGRVYAVSPSRFARNQGGFGALRAAAAAVPVAAPAALSPAKVSPAAGSTHRGGRWAEPTAQLGARWAGAEQLPVPDAAAPQPARARRSRWTPAPLPEEAVVVVDGGDDRGAAAEELRCAKRAERQRRRRSGGWIE